MKKITVTVTSLAHSIIALSGHLFSHVDFWQLLRSQKYL